MAEQRNSPGSSCGITRRDFARGAALAAATVALPGRLLAPHEATAAAPQQPEQPKLSAESSAEVEAKFQALLRKYGSRLSEEQKADARRLLTESQKSLDALRAFPLNNSDQPATVFELYPEAPSAVQHRAARRGLGR